MIKKKKKTKRMRRITAGELSKILKEHERWIATDWKEGEKADLSNVDLSGANLSGIRLCEANLCSADLSSADLRKTDFFSADLSEADLSEADLRGAMLYAADLSGACLEGVKGLTKAGLIEKPSKVVINSEKVIKDSFIQNGASCLWHMTHKENIQSILEHGILNHYDAYSLLVKPVDISIAASFSTGRKSWYRHIDEGPDSILSLETDLAIES